MPTITIPLKSGARRAVAIWHVERGLAVQRSVAPAEDTSTAWRPTWGVVHVASGRLVVP